LATRPSQFKSSNGEEKEASLGWLEASSLEEVFGGLGKGHVHALACQGPVRAEVLFRKPDAVGVPAWVGVGGGVVAK
jgi:hypothetical protein